MSSSNEKKPPPTPTPEQLTAIERLNTVGRISTAVLHDVNQPLSYVYTNAERLQQLAGAMPELKRLLDEGSAALNPRARTELSELHEEFRDIVEDILTGCHTMRELAINTRGLLRPGTSYSQTPANPLLAIGFAQNLVRQQAIRKRVTLRPSLPDQLPSVSVDQAELVHVLVQLLTNSCDAAKDDDSEIEINASADQTAVTIEVRDNCTGMTPEVLQHARTPFFSTRSDSPGLGLHLCQQVVESHGGTLSLESTLGQGTTATLSLPLSG